MKQFKVLRVLLLFSFFFCFISSVERKDVPFLSKKDLCPYFGDLSTRQIPWESTYLNWLSNERMVYVKNRFGKELRLPEKVLRFAQRIKTAEERDTYKVIYEDVCGGTPPFWNMIAFNQKEKINNRQNKRKEILDGKRFAASMIPFDPIKEEKQKILKKVESLKSKLDKVEQPNFQVMGKVLSQKGNDLVLYGSSIPLKSSKLQVPGFVYNGLILLKNHKKSDIKSPSGYSVKHVQAEGLEYVKTVRMNAALGENVPVYVFRHKKNTKSEKRIAYLKKELKENLSLLASLD